jgi:glycerol-3-phosphate cytidylyltransferase
MIRIGYAPGAFDLFHIGHLNLLRRAKERCEYLIAGVVSDEALIAHKGVTPVVPLAERIEIVRNCRHVDAAHAATTDDKLEIWRDLRSTSSSRETTGKGPKRVCAWSGSSQKSASKSPIFLTRRRRLAVGCAGPCRT